MKILHLCPLWFPVAKNSKGGIETLLPGLLAALEAQGVENTIIASGDSDTVARLIPAVDVNIWDQMEAGAAWEYDGYIQHAVLMALEMAEGFDVVHSHVGWPAYVLSSVPGIGEKILHTQHNPVTRDLQWFVLRHPDMWFSAVSESQARGLRQQGAARCTVIPSGIDVTSFTFQPHRGDGLLFLGRIEEEKGPDIAIRVARELDRPLTLAGPAVDGEYFTEVIEPLLDDQIRYLGVVDHAHKNELLGRAACVLMPTIVEEGFGMVALEAGSCGTPVVALASGALPEVVEQGITGYLGDSQAELAGLASRAEELDRSRIRRRVAERFGLAAVAERYCGLYDAIAGRVRVT
jgi:glycosyltransferase involved in cell wall biosynthesis